MRITSSYSEKFHCKICRRVSYYACTKLYFPMGKRTERYGRKATGLRAIRAYDSRVATCVSRYETFETY